MTSLAMVRKEDRRRPRPHSPSGRMAGRDPRVGRASARNAPAGRANQALEQERGRRRVESGDHERPQTLAARTCTAPARSAPFLRREPNLRAVSLQEPGQRPSARARLGGTDRSVGGRGGPWSLPAPSTSGETLLAVASPSRNGHFGVFQFVGPLTVPVSRKRPLNASKRHAFCSTNHARR